MTLKEDSEIRDLDVMNANIAKIEELSTRLAAAMSRSKPIPKALQGPSDDLFVKAASAYAAEMINNPAKIIEHQIGYWGKTLAHFADAQSRLSKGDLTPPNDETPKDRRFANPLWDTHPFFNFIKQQYVANAQAMTDAVQDIEGLDARDRKRIDYFTRQIVDMLAPTNFLATNPDALEQAVATNGESLVTGLENLVRDIEAHDGQMIVSLADTEAFEVGRNLGTTKGSVVFRNRMFELIQYAPSTETVHDVPLLLFPPWINKFYVLDLKDKNSLIKWVVDQGYTLFVVSWVNPDESYAEVGMDQYVEEGFLTAIDKVKEITGAPKINVTGYCIAGTTLSITLGLLKQRKDTSVNSATFFTTLTDFSDQGEVGVFLDDDFVDGIEVEARRTGIMSSLYMSRTFSYLRANDLIYQPAIRSYMLGEAPPAFDLLYWNGDGTNLPGKMAVEYLRHLCQGDKLATTGFPICGTHVHLSEVDVPVCAIGCETDHIAAWSSSYNGVRQMGAEDKTFILSQSGHIAGIVNPPSKKKYGHYTNDDMSLPPQEWKDAAKFNEGSWWPRWETWLKGRSGDMIPARNIGDSGAVELAPAPGTYVTARGTL
ncbi:MULTISPECIES: PHA/PHB synthase family protein [Pacificibacter]|uniref:PHA/PHB synthase family protein n=1 Tax=Pacificibacter TaxID=1042323 RepID=UPI001C09BFF3|nr:MULTISPECIES: class I poly(R)-hydroxyalkanoic acid synthase [Pacificibacter]MBU2935838.1 class I poly(R)-hydroxyalkanoic acid synthase [Pacificibacter marinus]MDO6614333.1 class I poly(R)-hydroxyalkanoic acid synthase [Pacificibacter sp. 1_MG-2023]